MDPFGILWFVLGCVVTWWFARQSSRELKQLNVDLQHDNAVLRQVVEKIPAELHALIANDPRTKLTMEQVAQLAASVSRLRDVNAPRQLTGDQRQQLVASLRQLEPKSLRIVSTGGDDEADHFRDQLTMAFQDAGWPVTSATAVAATNVNGLSLDYFGGHLSSTTPPGDDTLRLQAALEQTGLKVRTRSLPSDEHDLHWLLCVGQKPRMSPSPTC